MLKKVTAAVLALVMSLGLVSVAFADDEPVIYVSDSSKIYVYDSSEGKNIEVTAEELNDHVASEAKIYIELLGEENDDKSTINTYNAYFTSKVGTLKDGPNIEYVKVYDTGDSNGKYIYCVSLQVPAVSTKSYDLAGEIAVAKTTTAAKNLEDAYVFDLSTEVKYAAQEDVGADGSILVSEDEGYLLSFSDDADYVDIEIGTDLALFSVDVSGQSDVNMLFSTKYNADFAAMYDYANIDFLSFTKSPVFNKIGDLYIYADEDTYIYEVTEDGAKEISGAEYDEDYGAWHIRTRSLTSYAISDVELDTTTDTSDSSSESSSSTEDTSKPNPDTGR